jgi:transposase
MKQLDIKKNISQRTLYRTLERVGKNFNLLHYNYQDFLKKNNLVDDTQLTDFSSFYVEGKKSELSEYGYSRDRRPDKQQINFGISTGITGIPSALTIQKGNVEDKTHMKEMLKLIDKILPESSLLIFDCGANSKNNKEKIIEMRYNYLTLKQKNIRAYKRYLRYFSEYRNEAKEFSQNERDYLCVKLKDENFKYIFFCPELYEDQLRKKKKLFEKQKEKGNNAMNKKHQRLPSDKGWIEFLPFLQSTLSDIENPYLTGVEGFFILESSVDADPEKILGLYKERDKAEKFIRNLKEGLELRPIRHWNANSIIGMIFICFLTNFLINLTVKLAKNPLIKNVKLLKKFLINLTLTVVYPKNRFRFTILSNISPQIRSLFDSFLDKYYDKSLELRW